MNSLDKQIRDRIHAFAEELAELVKAAAVESVQDALGGSTPTRKKLSRQKATPKGKPAKARKKAGRVRRTPAQLEAMSGKIMAYVKANPGQRLEQIAVDLGMHTSDMKRPVSLMMEAKKLSTKGQRRGTSYYAGKAKGAVRKKATKKKATRRKKAK